MAHGCEVLVQEGVAQAVTGVGQQQVDRPAACRFVQPRHAVMGGQVDAQRRDVAAAGTQRDTDLIDRWLIGSDQQVVAFAGTQPRQLQADAGGSAGDQRQMARR
jgi:hypothetical protein